MIDFHLTNNASVTVAARPVPVAHASAFGVIQTDTSRRITGFQEKPKKPTPLADDPALAYVSMGNYIFNRDVLVQALAKAQRNKQHDFGSHVIPDLVGTGQVFAYDFATNVIPGTLPEEEKGYWRDVGTISAYFDAHMDMLGKTPRFELDNKKWPIHPSGHGGPATKILHGYIRNSIIAEGSVIHKARIRNSVIRSGVIIEDGVSVDECIIMDSVVLRKGCRLKRAIVDKLNIIGEGETFGFDPGSDRFKCHIDASGISIIPKGGRKMKKTRE